jgi:hypothetical protein
LSADDSRPVTVALRQSEGEGYAFVARPNTADPVSNSATNASAFTSAKFFVPERGAQSHAVGFVSSDLESREDVRVDGFIIGAQTMRMVEGGGLLHRTVYCAFPTAKPGVWSLAWNETNTTPDKSNGVPVTLRTLTSPGWAKPPRDEPTECSTWA